MFTSDSYVVKSLFSMTTNLHGYCTLEIEAVTLGDTGQYMCEVENAVGRATATATLTVLMPPSWRTQPPAEIREQADGKRSLTVDCTASGTPTPHILWRREGISPEEFSNVSECFLLG